LLYRGHDFDVDAMLKKFNLIVTTFRYREFDVIDEMMDLLDDIGDSNATCDVTNISGLITVNTNLDPFWVIEKFRDIIRSEDWRFRYVLRVIPIEAVVESSLPEIATAAIDLSTKKISPPNSFKLSVEKRHNSSLRTQNLIHTIAKEINNPVNLDAPSWIVLIEILGNVTGVSVLQDDQIFNSTSEKREIGTDSYA
jgi:tRNA acetyltransferase TAN1